MANDEDDTALTIEPVYPLSLEEIDDEAWKYQSTFALTPRLALEIIDTIATTTTAIGKLCKAHKTWPSLATLYRLRLRYDAFGAAFDKAIEARQHLMSDKVEEILDRTETKTYIDSNGNIRLDTGYVALAKLRVDQTRYEAETYAPGTFSKKSDTTVTVQVGHEKALEHFKDES
jgi:hypothetical protein